MKLHYFGILGLIAGSASSSVEAARWQVDHAHSSVGFEVDHLAFSTVAGRFNQFSGTFETDDKTGALVKVSGDVVADSINTDEPKRDKHLRSPDFFDVQKFPKLSFVADALKAPKGGSESGKARLTIRDVTKDVTFNFKNRGTAKDPWGNMKAAWEATAEINRKDFGLKWNKAIETGGLLVGENVKIIVRIQGDAVQEASKPAVAESAPTKKK